MSEQPDELRMVLAKGSLATWTELHAALVQAQAAIERHDRALREYESRLTVARSLIPPSRNREYFERTGQAALFGGDK